MGNFRTIKNGQSLQGVIALLFTPFSSDGKEVDAASLHRQIDRVLESGVSAVVACGKAGEFEGLTPAEIEQVLALVLERVAGRVPVGMGIISVEREQGLQAAAIACRCGADFAMVKKLTRQQLHEFYLDIAALLPVMVYDQSNEGNLDLEQEILPLLQASERIVAVKVSGNVYSFGQLKEAAPDVPLLCGWDTFSLMAYLSGADGVVAGSAAVMPEREVALHQLALAGHWEEARKLFYRQMLPLIAFSTPDPYAFSVCKLVLHWRGLFDSPVVRPPYVNTPEWMVREIRALARQLDLVD
jgi:4-hydroxy-tetrahydrodipicolinate synthase